MGTKIQCKTYLPTFYSVKDLNGHANNRVSLLNHEEQTLRNVHHFDFFASCVPGDGFFEYDKEKVRQIILKHELIFRHQLQELHRLHRRQMELMSELKTRELQKSSLFEFIKGENRIGISRGGNEDKYNANTTTLEFSKRTNCFLADLNEPIFLEEAPILASDANPNRINCLADGVKSMDKLSQNHTGRDSGNGFKNVHIDINADVHSDSLHNNNTKAEKPKKKTIFGVVIFEGNEEPAVTKQDSSKGALPWFMVKSQHSLNESKEGKNYHHTDLDSLKICSQQVFRKSETDEDFYQILNKKQEAMPSTFIKDSKHRKIESLNNVDYPTAVKKIFGVPICNSSKDLNTSFADDSLSKNQFEAKDNITEKRLDNNISGLSHQIDLNLSLDEEIDVCESEGNPCLEAKSRDRDIKSAFEEEPNEPREEVVRQAAEAIVSISQNSSNSLYNMAPESAATDCLKWFSELITSEVNGHDECIVMEASIGKGGNREEGSIPDGMDYLEFATLKLRDMKEEGKCYEPSILEFHNGEEIGPTTHSKRPRRGQARRGRQRKDFQRDVLPGILSLSKHELSEDILTFEELLRTTGCSWQSQKKAAKSGWGRKRRGGSTPPSPVKTATPSNQPLFSQVEIEKASLTGWGKRTRRLPRQRCGPTSNHVPMMQC